MTAQNLLPDCRTRSARLIRRILVLTRDTDRVVVVAKGFYTRFIHSQSCCGKMNRFHLTPTSMNLLTRITIALFLLTPFATPLTTAAHAEDETPTNSAMSQVTSVSQLRDIQPIDWAFQALQSLVERYGCVSGYPDKTFRGNRALTRYEFAAGMNACQDRIQDLIAISITDAAKKEDLKTLRTLQEQFAAELTTLRGRTDRLEAKTATLEKTIQHHHKALRSSGPWASGQ